MNRAGNSGYYHSVRLEEEKCQGCTHCIRTCPTEAIRVRNGKAKIIDERCIDCGECIRTCPNSAKITTTDPLDSIKTFKYKVAIPAPSFSGQFSRKYMLDKALFGFMLLGFDEVMEVAFGASIMAKAITQYLHDHGAELPRPMISSACPAVVRLIQVKFPGLVGNIIPLESPMEITARYARRKIAEMQGIPDSDIGVFFITPCPAKVTAVKQPVAAETSAVNGVISMTEMVNQIKKHFSSLRSLEELQKAPGMGIGWGRRDGEVESVDIPNKMAVDGIQHVSKLLEKIEAGGFRNIRFIEAQACVGGCVGGVLTVENPFLAKLKVDLVSDAVDKANDGLAEKVYTEFKESDFLFSQEIQPRPILTLDADVGKAMEKLKKIDEIHAELPGIDCGACGCPNCRAFAADVVNGLASRMDCHFDLRERVTGLAQEIFALAKKLPHTMQEKGNPDETK
ncbi:MAG TPA: [Fe-Fe] hydrogenase large subunit C-terminal domain-containing protein [bacterium]|nr:[Fe-Fe] hydrogenase large subunit C-terminal domain-containing protein [bacterium]